MQNDRQTLRRGLFLALCCCALAACSDTTSEQGPALSAPSRPALLQPQAENLLQLPLHCVETEYPNKLSQMLNSDADLRSPRSLHPAFYGCFDWHSAVHGHWSMVRLVREFPTMRGH